MSQDPYRYFRIEARELVDQLGHGILGLEKGAAASDEVPRLLRLAHTLKGAARVVKKTVAADLAHALEDALAPSRDCQEALPRATLDAVRGLVDALEAEIAALAESTVGSRPDATPERAQELAPAAAGEVDALLAGLAEAHTQLRGLERVAVHAERARHLAELLSAQPTCRQNQRLGSLADELKSVSGRVERGLAAVSDALDRGLDQLRDQAEQLHLAPASRLFLALERTALDAARELGKEVTFAGHGGEVRLESRALAVVQGALVQLVRNALAHGIETPEVRRTQGKPAAGQVLLTVARQGRRIVFRCHDDGRGVDLGAVARAAAKKGLPAAELAHLGAEELFRLLLRGGISTSGTVTGVAGRGIGLDLVRDAAERLGGEVRFASDGVAGTTVELSVPLALAALEVLLVEAAGQKAAIPLESVRGTLRARAAELAVTAGRVVLLWNGQALPVASLAELLGRGEDQRPSEAWSAVVVEGGGGLAVVAIDRLLGTGTVMLSPLPELARCSGLVAGAWLDTAGSPRLVLEPEALVEAAGRTKAAAPNVSPLPLLVIDDSLTTRMLEQSILESAGYEVHLACSGEEALVAARQTRYALFLVDVEMPGMDGFEFLDEIRSDPRLSEVPAILVTSRSAAQDRQRGADAGARGFIAKGEFDQSELLGNIRRLVG